jgi:hypothetical protein
MSDEVHADTSNATTSLLDLAEARVFTLVGKKEYTIKTQRLSREDYEAYFAAIYYTTKQEGRDLVKSVDTESASILLADRAITEAHGYTVAGGADLMSLPNWRQLLPLNHRRSLGQLLVTVVPSVGADDEMIYPEGYPISLDAIWGSAEDGGARVYKGLVHVLRAPSEAQHRRYLRASSATRVFGGSRAGTTQYLGAQMVAAEIYDELVVSVDGYGVAGRPLADVQSIRREMDVYHKFAAAFQVLQPSNTATQKMADEAKKEAE